MEERWTEHFKEILNRPPPTHELISASDPAADLNTRNSRNCPRGYDKLNAELFKTDSFFYSHNFTANFSITSRKETLCQMNGTMGSSLKYSRKATIMTAAIG